MSGKEQKIFHGAGLEKHQNFKAWWDEARKLEEPPSPAEFLLHFGVPSDLVVEACWNILHGVVSLLDDGDHLDFPAVGPGEVDYFVQNFKR